jgi:hypothetical protein
MPETLIASKQGQTKIKQAREEKGWTVDSYKWLEEASKVLDPNWPGGEYFAEGISYGTWKRFLTAKNPINAPAFKAYCQVLGLNWEDVRENQPQRSEQNQTAEVMWFLVLSGTINNEVDRQRAEAIVAHLQKVLEDPFLKIQEIKKGSVVLVLQGSREGFEWAEYLFITGELTELLGVPVLDVRLAPVSLSQWLQNNFTEAIQTGWQTIEEIFGPQQLAFRYAAVKRAKQIDLGDELTVALVADVAQEADDEIDIILWLYATGSQPKLPENLKLIVVDESGEPLEEVPAGSGNNCIRQPLSGSPGDRFGVKIVVGDVSVTEEFVI